MGVLNGYEVSPSIQRGVGQCGHPFCRTPAEMSTVGPQTKGLRPSGVKVTQCHAITSSCYWTRLCPVSQREELQLSQNLGLQASKGQGLLDQVVFHPPIGTSLEGPLNPCPTLCEGRVK